MTYITTIHNQNFLFRSFRISALTRSTKCLMVYFSSSADPPGVPPPSALTPFPMTGLGLENSDNSWRFRQGDPHPSEEKLPPARIRRPLLAQCKQRAWDVTVSVTFWLTINLALKSLGWTRPWCGNASTTFLVFFKCLCKLVRRYLGRSVTRKQGTTCNFLYTNMYWCIHYWLTSHIIDSETIYKYFLLKDLIRSLIPKSERKKPRF